MKLIRTEFSKFKSIVGESLDIERDVTCLVGINEAGKSNVLKALLKVDTSEKISEDDFSRHDSAFGSEDASPEIKLTFVPNDEDEKEDLSKIFGHEVTLVVMSKDSSGYRLNYPSIDHKKSIYYVVEEVEEVEDLGKDSTAATPAKVATEKALTIEEQGEIRKKVFAAVRDTHIPNFVFFDSVNFDEFYLPLNGEVLISEFVSEPGSMMPIKNLLLLGGVKEDTYQNLVASTEIQRIRRDKLLGDVSDEINKKIFEVAWPVKTVGVKLSAEGDILKIRLHEKGKTSPFTPGERSRGLQWALAFNVHFLASVQDDLQGSVLLIDEPGVFLHVDAQKYLLEKTFEQIVDWGTQIVYTTHLPYLINSQYPERIRILEKDREDTVIGNKAWSHSEFSLLPEPVKTALGLQWSEILNMGENNLLVEGPSDQIILRELYKALEINDGPTVIPTYGDTKMPASLALVKIEGKKGFGIVDIDSDITELRGRASLAGITDDSIEYLSEVMGDNNIASIEDIVPEEIYREAVFRVYGPICSRSRNFTELKKEDIVTTSPRVAATEDQIATKIKAKKHSFMKMEVARAVKEIITEKKKAGIEIIWTGGETAVQMIASKFTNETIVDDGE
jgi:predicted ATP-dependent endonuclease of OLD family